MHLSKALAATIALFACAPVAQSAIITQTEIFSGTPNFTESLTFDQFDPSLGTLSRVTVSAFLNAGGAFLEADNEGDAGTLSASYTVSLDLSSVSVSFLASGLIPALNGIGVTDTQNSVVGADDGDGTGLQTTGSDYVTFLALGGSASDSADMDSLIFSQYTGLGTFIIEAEVAQALSFTGTSGQAGAFSPNPSSGSITVEYEYHGDPVIPEPGTIIALLAAALAGGVIVRRRFARRG